MADAEAADDGDDDDADDDADDDDDAADDDVVVLPDPHATVVPASRARTAPTPMDRIVRPGDRPPGTGGRYGAIAPPGWAVSSVQVLVMVIAGSDPCFELLLASPGAGSTCE